MINRKSLIIAVDFDGTIVEDNYPSIGAPKLFAFETLKKLQEKGYRLILWTYRCGSRLSEAVDFCKQHGIEFYAVNQSFPEENYDMKVSRKINADLFIDDRNFGGFPGWGAIFRELSEETKGSSKSAKKQKKNLFSFLKKNND